MNAKEKHVYLFSELDQAEAYAKDGWDSVRGLLGGKGANLCLLYTSPSPRDGCRSRMPSSA